MPSKPKYMESEENWRAKIVGIFKILQSDFNLFLACSIFHVSNISLVLGYFLLPAESN